MKFRSKPFDALQTEKEFQIETCRKGFNEMRTEGFRIETLPPKIKSGEEKNFKLKRSAKIVI